MDIQKFIAMLNDPARPKQDLVAMRENAVNKNALEHVRHAEHALDTRFPDWRIVNTRRGGATPTEVMFRGSSKHFDTAKEAYVWLIERFIQHYPKPFVELDWETEFVAKGTRALFFHRNLKKLFGTHDNWAGNRNDYQLLSNGWHAKLVLSNEQKLDLLVKFSTVAQLGFGKDWDWNGEGAKHPGLDVDEFLREMEGSPKP